MPTCELRMPAELLRDKNFRYVITELAEEGDAEYV